MQEGGAGIYELHENIHLRHRHAYSLPARASKDLHHSRKQTGILASNRHAYIKQTFLYRTGMLISNRHACIEQDAYIKQACLYRTGCLYQIGMLISKWPCTHEYI